MTATGFASYSEKRQTMLAPAMVRAISPRADGSMLPISIFSLAGEAAARRRSSAPYGPAPTMRNRAPGQLSRIRGSASMSV
jgi:hypothetical protein